MGGDILWQAIGAVGDLVSGIGVIATLGYLAVQIRHTSVQLLRAERNTTMEQWSAWRRAIVTNADVARIVVDGFTNPRALSPQDAHRARMAIAEALMLDYNQWRREQEGLAYDDENHAAMRKGGTVLRYLATPLGREVWPSYQAWIAPAYCQLIDDMLATIPQQPSSQNVPDERSAKRVELHDRAQ